MKLLAGDSINKFLGVFVFWVIKDLASFACFNNFAMLHYKYPIADIMHNGKVV